MGGVGFDVGGRGFCCGLAGAMVGMAWGRSVFTSGDRVWKHKAAYVDFIGGR